LSPVREDTFAIIREYSQESLFLGDFTPDLAIFDFKVLILIELAFAIIRAFGLFERESTEPDGQPAPRV